MSDKERDESELVQKLRRQWTLDVTPANLERAANAIERLCVERDRARAELDAAVERAECAQDWVDDAVAGWEAPDGTRHCCRGHWIKRVAAPAMAALAEAVARAEKAEAENERHQKANLVRAVTEGWREDVDGALVDYINAEGFDGVPWRIAENATAKSAALVVERDRLRDALADVHELHAARTLHTGEGPYCFSCDTLSYPCPTAEIVAAAAAALGSTAEAAALPEIETPENGPAPTAEAGGAGAGLSLPGAGSDLGAVVAGRTVVPPHPVQGDAASDFVLGNDLTESSAVVDQIATLESVHSASPVAPGSAHHRRDNDQYHTAVKRALIALYDATEDVEDTAVRFARRDAWNVLASSRAC